MTDRVVHESSRDDEMWSIGPTTLVSATRASRSPGYMWLTFHRMSDGARLVCSATST